MARPYKSGLEYFPLDVHAFDDPKLESLHYHHGPIGVFVYIRILALVYENGYYLEKTHDELLLTLHRLVGPFWVRVDKISEMIHACVELRLFERAFFTQGVITSISIQKQFILSTKRRRNININKYWLLDSATMEQLGAPLSMQKNIVNVDNNLVCDSNNPINVNNSTQSKSKSKSDIKTIYDKSIYGTPKMHFITKLIIQRKYIKDCDSQVLKYNSLFEAVIDKYEYENVLSAVNYIIAYSNKTETPIDDRYNFMSTSLYNNLEKFRNRKDRVDIEKWFKQRFLSVDR
jgi:hypothetical protein